MPIFNYKCGNCSHEEERIVSFSKKDEQNCVKCENHTDYVPSFKIGGVIGLPNGFAPTRSSSRIKKDIGGADTK